MLFKSSNILGLLLLLGGDAQTGFGLAKADGEVGLNALTTVTTVFTVTVGHFTTVVTDVFTKTVRDGSRVTSTPGEDIDAIEPDVVEARQADEPSGFVTTIESVFTVTVGTFTTVATDTFVRTLSASPSAEPSATSSADPVSDVASITAAPVQPDEIVTILESFTITVGTFTTVVTLTLFKTIDGASNTDSPPELAGEIVTAIDIPSAASRAIVSEAVPSSTQAAQATVTKIVSECISTVTLTPANTAAAENDGGNEAEEEFETGGSFDEFISGFINKHKRAPSRVFREKL